jgi:hypothetical protein
MIVAFKALRHSRRFFQPIAPGIGNARFHFGGCEGWASVSHIKLRKFFRPCRCVLEGKMPAMPKRKAIKIAPDKPMPPIPFRVQRHPRLARPSVVKVRHLSSPLAFGLLPRDVHQIQPGFLEG